MGKDKHRPAASGHSGCSGLHLGQLAGLRRGVCRQSGRVGELLRPLLELVVGQGGVTDHLVRKLAHFTEYAVLGALLLLLTAVGFRVRLQTVVNCLFF